MKKSVLTVLTFAIAATQSRATLPVVDYSHIAQDAANEVVNLVKYASTEVAAVQTQLNTLQTYENTVLQVARFGNPAALRSLPGVSTVAEIYQMYGQLSRDYLSAQSLLNPQRYQNDMNYILGSYQLPKWNGFKTATGLPVLPGQGLFQFDTGSWNIANSAQQQLQMVAQQRQKLQQQRDQALSSLQASSTASEVQKYHAVVDALNGAIAEVSQAEQEIYHRTALQTQQLQAGQQIYNASQVQQRQASDYQTIDAGLSGLPMGSFRQPLLWGGNQ
jgi:flagellar biosynthesis chaperone FliJ